MTKTVWGRWSPRGVLVLLCVCLLCVCTTTGCNSGGGGGSKEFVLESVSPEDGASAVPFDAVISVVFSNEVDAATASNALLLQALWPEHTTDIPVVADVDRQRVTYTPAWPLAPGTVYMATLTTAVADVRGHKLRSPVSWSFTARSLNLIASGERGKVWVFGEDIYVLAPADGPLAGEFDGTVTQSISGPDFVVPPGATVVTATTALDGTIWDDFLVDGDLELTGTGPVVIRVSSNLRISGEIRIAPGEGPVDIDFYVSGRVRLDGSVDLGAQAISGNGGGFRILSPGVFQPAGVLVDGRVNVRSIQGVAGRVEIVSKGDLIVTGVIDARSLAGGFANRVALDGTRVIIRGGGIAADGANATAGLTPAGQGGEVLLLSEGDLEVRSETWISANGGASDGDVGGKGGFVALNGQSPQIGGDLNRLVVAGVVQANGGRGMTPGDGGLVSLGEDFYSAKEPPNNGDWVQAVITGTVQAEGTDGKVDFHALDPAGQSAFHVDDSGVVTATAGTLTRDGATSVSKSPLATVSDRDGDTDTPPDGTDVDAR